MQDATHISMKNRTGMQMSPADSRELLEAVSSQELEGLPDPENDGLAEVRTEYLAEAGPLGTVPAPATPRGPVKNTSSAREKLCSCNISKVNTMNSTRGTLAAIDASAALLSAAAPFNLML